MSEAVRDRFTADRIRYASVWEDADVLCEALGPVATGGRLLSIASGGDNALALLTLDPREVVAADLSSAQLACLELRRVAFARLEHAELLAFLGVTPCVRRLQTYGSMRRELPLGVRHFWDQRLELLEPGLIHAGKFERYLRMFGRRVLPLIFSGETRLRLLFRRSPAEQLRFYREVWDRPGWRCWFLVFFSRQVLGWLGRDPALLRHVRAHVGRRLLARTRSGLTRVPTWSNPYLTYIITGNYSHEALPRYLRPEFFAAIRERLGRITLVEGAIQETGRGPFEGMNLSDLFEYLSPQEHRRVYAALVDQCRPGARMAYWNLLASRGRPPELAGRVRPLSEEARALHHRDRAWFYQAFHLDLVL